MSCDHIAEQFDGCAACLRAERDEAREQTEVWRAALYCRRHATQPCASPRHSGCSCCDALAQEQVEARADDLARRAEEAERENADLRARMAKQTDRMEGMLERQERAVQRAEQWERIANRAEQARDNERKENAYLRRLAMETGNERDAEKQRADALTARVAAVEGALRPFAGMSFVVTDSPADTILRNYLQAAKDALLAAAPPAEPAGFREAARQFTQENRAAFDKLAGHDPVAHRHCGCVAGLSALVSELLDFDLEDDPSYVQARGSGHDYQMWQRWRALAAAAPPAERAGDWSEADAATMLEGVARLSETEWGLVVLRYIRHIEDLLHRAPPAPDAAQREQP